jgi:hypothetical protein
MELAPAEGDLRHVASAESRLHVAKTRLSGCMSLKLKKVRANQGGIRGLQELRYQEGRNPDWDPKEA